MIILNLNSISCWLILLYVRVTQFVKNKHLKVRLLLTIYNLNYRMVNLSCPSSGYGTCTANSRQYSPL